MMIRKYLPGIALAALAVAGASGEASAQDRDWDWKGRIDSGDAIEIKGINGGIRAEGTSGSEVEVFARIHGKRGDVDEVQVEMIEHSGGVTICAIYPSKGREPNTCGPGSRGHQKIKDNSAKVDFRVRVPAGVRFVGYTINGDVAAHDIRSDVRVATVNGGIDVSATGLAEATTVNGSITASMGRTNWEGPLKFITVNGSVTLEFPDELNCELDVQTVNGNVSSDFPITVSGSFSPGRELRGTIGSGGRELKVKTVNGSVRIRRS